MELPEPAPWIVDLPRDRRGFPAPAEAGWLDGKPILSQAAADQKIVLGVQRACAVCGYVMPIGSTVYRAFGQADAAQVRVSHESAFNSYRKYAFNRDGPLHLSCVLYSAMACPYLREKDARLGPGSQVNPGGRRGARAAIIGFAEFGLMLSARPHRLLDQEEPMPLFAYLDLVEDIGYRDGRELEDRYAQAVVADAAVIDTSKPRLYWTDSEADLISLLHSLQGAEATLARAVPVRPVHIRGVGRYVTLML